MTIADDLRLIAKILSWTAKILAKAAELAVFLGICPYIIGTGLPWRRDYTGPAGSPAACGPQ